MAHNGTSKIPLPVIGETIGVSGLKVNGGWINEEWLPELIGKKGVDVYKEMGDNDPSIGAMLYAMITTLRAVQWEVQPFSDPGADPTPEDIERADFLQTNMDDMTISFGDFIAEALSKLQYGWSLHEVTYKIRDGALGEQPSKHDDGLIGWAALDQRAQETLSRWQFDDETGVLLGMIQMDHKGAEHFISVHKAVHFRTTTRKNNPEGRSLLRNAYTAWYRKRHIETAEAIGVERNLVGIPFAYIDAELFDPNASTEEKAALEDWKRIITQLRNDSAASLLIPARWSEDGKNRLFEVGLMSSPGTSPVDTSAIALRLDRQIYMTLLQDVILLGHENVGSLALADVKKQLSRASMAAQLEEIRVVLNRAVTTLFFLNGYDLTRLPEFITGEIADQTIEEFTSIIKDLVDAGFDFSDLETQNAVRGRAGMPLLDPSTFEQQPGFQPSTTPDTDPDDGNPTDE